MIVMIKITVMTKQITDDKNKDNNSNTKNSISVPMMIIIMIKKYTVK